MSSSSESHGTHDLNATQSGDVASLVVLLNKWADVLEVQSGDFVNEDLRRAASALSSLQEENARLREAVDAAYGFLGGVDGAVEIRQTLLRSLQAIPEEVGK